ncbi:MAG: GspH/FimT family pseudopilin [Gammaproteobacteria bacterium]
MQRQQTGFSIIELMVVLTVAGILLAWGVPSFNYQIKSNRLTSAVNDLVAAMHLSRSEASKRKLPVAICTSDNALNEGSESCSSSVGWNEGWLVYADVNLSGNFDTGDVVIQRQDTQSPDLEMLGSNDIKNEIFYLPNGFAQLPLDTTSNRYIVYCNADREDRFSRVLSISNSGRPQILPRDSVPNGAPSCSS